MSIELRAKAYGEIIGGWKIQELLGTGSGGQTGVFHIIRDQGLGHPEDGALKIVSIITVTGQFDRLSEKEKKEYEAERDERCQKAISEIKLMEKLKACSNVVTYHDWKPHDWKMERQLGCDLLIRMEYLDTLADLELENDRIFEEADIIRVGIDICKALIECEEYGIVHRDIKPANIFRYKDRNQYLLGDFGISRIVKRSQFASTGIGTDPYAAPEQYYGKYDKRVDIYSLGLTLYELSNENRLPYAESRYVSEKDIAMRREAIQLPRPCNKGISDELVKCILQACAHRPEERYQSAQEFLDALAYVTSHNQKKRFRDEIAGPIRFRIEGTMQTENRELDVRVDQYATERARPRGALEEKSAQKRKLQNQPEDTVTEFVIKGGILIKYNGPGGTIRIPDEVTRINYAAFRDRVDITQVLLPKGLNTIGGHAFSGCTKLTDVDISEGVTSIGGYAFFNCVSLGKIYVPSSVVAIEAYAFAKCTGLSSVTISDGVKKVGAYAFKECNNLIDLSLPDSIIAIGTDAFSNCPNLTIHGSFDSFARKYAEESHIPFAEGIEWLVSSAEKGDSYAQFSLGVCYDLGEGVSQDKAMAAKWFRKAAEQGHSRAQFKLGVCYASGEGVSQDKAMAAKWYRKAAEQGHSDAQYKLGLCYMEGEDPPKDKAKAIDWFIEAIKNGNKKAQEALVECCSRAVWIDGKEVVHSPTSGNGYKVKCKVGQKVQAGDVLVVIEEIKIGYKVRAVWSGTVQFVADIMGKNINTGDLLVILDRS